MKFSWRHSAGAFVLSVAMLASTGSGIADAKKGQKNDKIKDNGESAISDPCKRPGTQCDPRQGGSSAERNKSDKIKDDPPLAAERNKSDTIKPDPPLAGERNKSDTIKPNPPEVARNKSDTIKPDPPLAAAGKNKSGWILPALGGIALVGTIVAVSGGGNPKSP